MIKISDNENGIIFLKKDVFTSIAFISLQEENGIQLDKGTFKKAVTCKIEDEKVHISIDLKIRYGQNVQKTCKSVQNRVSKSIQDMTNVNCNHVDVNVIGFNFNAQ
ncbi:MAG: Asp23/Gls24 family envelope stress response protein [Erysipelotrichaceae bacterium]|nr:Asp23/Gls24 family envelope stress response protein [Erysipelotrichaceae bacterium]